MEKIRARASNHVRRAKLELERRKFVFAKSPRLKPARISDMQGMPHIVEELRPFIDYLKNYAKFKESGARTQPGIFLYGKPGTGKTLATRIIATESGARLINAEDFPKKENFWTDEDIRALFGLAREYHRSTGDPIVISFDELDPVIEESPFWWKAPLAEFLSELDGIGGKPEGIFVVGAAVDRARVNSAILRAGRLGHVIAFELPDTKGRKEILEHYVKMKPHDGVDVESIAAALPGCSPAEIEEMVERAYLDACLRSGNNGARLTDSDLIRQLLKHVLEPLTGSWESDQERHLACAHEAGHAIVGVELGCPVKLVVVPRLGYTKGITLANAAEDGHPVTVEDLERKIAVLFAGGIAEEMMGKRSIWAMDDVEEATRLSLKILAEWGDEKSYEIWWNPRSEDERLLIPEPELAPIFGRASELRNKCRKEAEEVLRRFGRGGLESVAKRLMEREFLLGEEVKRAVLEAKSGGADG